MIYIYSPTRYFRINTESSLSWKYVLSKNNNYLRLGVLHTSHTIHSIYEWMTQTHLPLDAHGNCMNHVEQTRRDELWSSVFFVWQAPADLASRRCLFIWMLYFFAEYVLNINGLQKRAKYPKCLMMNTQTQTHIKVRNVDSGLDVLIKKIAIRILLLMWLAIVR